MLRTVENNGKMTVERCCIVAICAIAVSVLLIMQPVRAFEQLTPAQSLIYDRAHLSNTVAGQQITYGYRSQAGTTEIVEDRVILKVNKAHEDNRRDVSLEFLSNERRMVLPDFTGYRGNPVIIAMLEHVAQRLGYATGGGVLYFRNRIRDALAKHEIVVETVDSEYKGRRVDATRIQFMPFAGDPYLAQQPEYTGASFSITLSEQVSGGVVAIAARSGQQGKSQFSYEIQIN